MTNGRGNERERSMRLKQWPNQSLVCFLWQALYTLLLLVLVPTARAGQSLRVVYDKEDYTRYRVEAVVDDNGTSPQVLFRQAQDVAIFVEGKWCRATTSTATTSSQTRNRRRFRRLDSDDTNDDNNKKEEYHQLEFVNRTEIEGYEKGLGFYKNGEVFHWSCHLPHRLLPLVTTYKNFDGPHHAVLFQVTWPLGAWNTSLSDAMGDYNSALATFPSLQANGLVPNALSWQGSFVTSRRKPSVGPIGGPTVFYNASDPLLTTVVVASPWGGNWKTFTAGSSSGSDDDDDNDDDNDDDDHGTTTNNNNKSYYSWTPGTSGRIQSLPPGFTQSIVLYQDHPSSGITGTLRGYGDRMQESRGNPKKLYDRTLETLGYQTDNGAYYCFCNDRNCSQTLIQEVVSLQQQQQSLNKKLSLGYLSFQGAGASSGRGKAAPWCVDTWGVDGGLAPEHYPMNLTTFVHALGNLPLQLYVPYFCPTSPYLNGTTPWSFVESDTSLPGCRDFNFRNVHPKQAKAFYRNFLQRGIDVAGMVSFETDFMNQNVNCVPEFVHTTDQAQTWQVGLATAAAELSIPLQWCYASPTDVLASLDLPAVTNFRVSYDYCYGESWKIGESSLLVWALGAAPSKDTLWTTDNNKTETPGCPWTADHENIAAELHVVLALMSTGPVGISDGIHMTNTTLLWPAIAQDGTLLQPSKPITAVDSSFLSSMTVAGTHDDNAKASSSGIETPTGYVYATYAGPSWIFVSFLLVKPFAVTLRDFWPRPFHRDHQSSIIWFAYRHFGGDCVHGADAAASGCVALTAVSTSDEGPISPSLLTMEIFTAPATDSYAPTITTVWQEVCDGWFLLGELDKYVALSPKRFNILDCSPSRMIVMVFGSNKEEVNVSALRRTGGTASDPHFTVIKTTALIHDSGATSVFIDVPSDGGTSFLQM